MFYPEHLRPDCERAAVFDKSIILDDFSLAEGCHPNPFGGMRIICIEGDTYMARRLSPKDKCSGDGPYPCLRGCRKDCHPPMDYKTDPFHVAPSVRDVCEENRPKRVGDECEEDEDCTPIVTDILERDTMKIVNTYLRCDTLWKRCVRTDPPPPIKDFMKSCDIHFSRKELKEAPHTFYGSGRTTDACDEKLCFIRTPDEKNNCVKQGCSRLCRGTDDCPQGTVCYQRDGLPRKRKENEPRPFAGSCLPSTFFNNTFDFPCVPFKD